MSRQTDVADVLSDLDHGSLGKLAAYGAEQSSRNRDRALETLKETLIWRKHVLGHGGDQSSYEGIRDMEIMNHP